MEHRWKNITADNGVHAGLTTGCAGGLAVFAIHGLFGLVHWSGLPAYLLIGIAFAFVAWGFERLWRHSVLHLLKPDNPVLETVSRLPFWFLSGGVAYTLGMLLAKRFGMIGFYDIPVKPIFLLGGKLGIAILWLVDAVHRFLRAKNSRISF